MCDSWLVNASILFNIGFSSQDISCLMISHNAFIWFSVVHLVADELEKKDQGTILLFPLFS